MYAVERNHRFGNTFHTDFDACFKDCSHQQFNSFIKALILSRIFVRQIGIQNIRILDSFTFLDPWSTGKLGTRRRISWELAELWRCRRATSSNLCPWGVLDGVKSLQSSSYFVIICNSRSLVCECPVPTSSFTHVNNSSCQFVCETALLLLRSRVEHTREKLLGNSWDWSLYG